MLNMSTHGLDRLLPLHRHGTCAFLRQMVDPVLLHQGLQPTTKVVQDCCILDHGVCRRLGILFHHDRNHAMVRKAPSPI